MPRPGKIGALPGPAWGAVVSMLSSPRSHPGRAWWVTVLSLRRTCKALAELVGAGCVGGAKRLRVWTADAAEQLEAAATAGLGRSVVVDVEVRWRLPEVEELEALARALAVAVERGHMIRFAASYDEYAPAMARKIEATLIEASREGLLSDADLGKGESRGWSIDAMAQLRAVQLSHSERETVATLVGAGALQRIFLWEAKWADLSILSSLREVKLNRCAVEDLSPLADVPLLVVWDCDHIKALPAMRHDVLIVTSCNSLTDVSGLAGGRVGRLELQRLYFLKDVSGIGAMRPPPRTATLSEMYALQDVSMLAGIRRLKVSRCFELDKAATLAALEGKVGTILWK